MSPTLSALVVAHNEAGRIAACLEKLAFCDEIVVVLDRCTDHTEAIARRFTDRLLPGAWPLEGERRNAGIKACTGDWVLEVDCDEHVPPALAEEIRRVIAASPADYHEIPVDNFIGPRRVRHGWGASFGKAAYPGLFRKGAKRWGRARVHPPLTWTGRDGRPAIKGAMLAQRLDHFVDRDPSDMLRRLDSYTTARALDLMETGRVGGLGNNLRRLFSRTFKCYVMRRGYREGGLGLMIALMAGLYPLIAHLKARHWSQFPPPPQG